jgi:Spy/CpxP family protein refolding chaperone
MGQKATFTVDAYPGQTFEGVVRQVRKAAQNVANVVTYIAVVGFTNTGDKLLPGMTANVRLVTDLRENVLKVPNAALRVRIAGVEPVSLGASSAVRGVPEPPGSGASGVSRFGLDTLQVAQFSWMGQAFAQTPGATGGGGGGGGFAAQRERLVVELQLSAEQKTKLDAIQAEIRPKFMGLRDMADEERAPAREKITAEMRQKISGILSPEQRVKYQAIVANASNAANAFTASASPQVGALPSAASLNRSAVVATMDAPENRAKRDHSVSVNEQTLSRNVAKISTTTMASMPPVAASSSAVIAGSPGSDGAGGGIGGGSGGGPLAEFRSRLIADVQLGAEQVAKVDALMAQMRPMYAALREMPTEDRAKARERITAQMRAQIGDLLTPEQKVKYAALQAETASRTATRGRIYLLGSDGKPVAYNVRLGITDGTSTELMVAPNSPNAQVLKEGALVIVGTAVTGAANSNAGGGQRPAGPRMPF